MTINNSIYNVFNRLIDEDNYSLSNLHIMMSQGFYTEARISDDTIQTLYPNFNKTFYSSWKERNSKTDLEHQFNTLIHYIHSYIFNGDERIVSIPRELSTMEEISEYKIIPKISLPELVNEFINILKGKVQLNDSQCKDIIEIGKFLEESNLIVLSDLEIFSKDLYCYFMDHFRKVPRDVEGFFRYILVYRANHLLIKNNKSYKLLEKHSGNKDIVRLLYELVDNIGLEKIAESFNRYKKLWLSLKTNKSLIPIINKLSKLSKKHHQAFATPVSKTIVADKNIKELSNLSINQLVNIICCVKDKKSAVAIYKIRNGTVYYKTRTKENIEDYKKLQTRAYILLKERIKSLFGKCCNYYIPEYLKIALPKRLKDIVGNLSFNSQIKTDVTDTPVIGIYWEGQDVDLSAITYFKNGKAVPFSWYSHSKCDPLLFSGDITQAPNGASELFALNTKSTRFKEFLSSFTALSVNNYSGIQDNIHICIGKLGSVDLKEYAYSLNPKDILFSYQLPSFYANSLRSFTIGAFTIEKDKLVYTFNAMSLNRNYVAKISAKEREVLKSVINSTIYLNDIFDDLGYVRVAQHLADVDLSLEKLNSDFWSKFF